jgi:hypothetical protein
MVELGVGKNMVRSIRFWSQAVGIATSSKRYGHAVTPFGEMLLREGAGLDPFLEDIRTLWLIHWQLSTNVQSPLLAWDFLLNHWQQPELVPSRVLTALQREATKGGEEISAITIEHHFDTFLHSYVPTRGRKGNVQEDNLDCPLVELELITKSDRSAGKSEPIYAFRREEKAEITMELFAYCLNEFWDKRHPTEATLQFQAVAHGHGSPGQIFKLPEDDIRLRLEMLADRATGLFTYTESASQQLLRRNRRKDGRELLREVYEVETARV